MLLKAGNRRMALALQARRRLCSSFIASVPERRVARPKTLSAAFARARQEQRLLYDWLRDNHDTFAAELGQLRPRDRWTRALRVIADLGLLDDRGNAVTRDTAIRTWKRVREDVAAARAKRQGAPPPALARGEIAPGVRGVAKAAAPVSAMPAAGTGTSPGTLSSDDPMQRLRQQMGASQVPMPKTVG